MKRTVTVSEHVRCCQSGGEDTKIIKDALPCILPILTDIVNHSLLSSVFPQAWKISEVIPLLKEGDHEVANNNRPISLLPAASKVCERVALNQFTQFMKAKKDISLI